MIKKIDTNKYLEFLEVRDYLEEIIVKTGRKILMDENFDLRFTSKNHIIEYHKRMLPKFKI